jgi:carboxypeptidase Taq
MSTLSEQFKQYLHEYGYYQRVTSLLYWDLATQTPKKGVEPMQEALSFFSTKGFSMMTAPEYADLLRALQKPEEYDQLSPAMQMTVRKYLEDYERDKNIPQEFYQAFVLESSRSEKAWEEAKEHNDFSIFAPHLEKMIAMTKEKLSYTHPGKDPYDVLVDQYETGMDTDTINRLFAELKEGLVPLMKKIAAAPQPDTSMAYGQFDIDSQKRVQELLLEYIGFDFEAGATGESAHPFTMDFSMRDSRVTNNFNERECINAFFSAIHEGGHAIFGQNIGAEYEDTCVSIVNMMGLHESQSRFYENILGRNINFWLPIYDRICEVLPAFRQISLEDLNRIINDVHPSLIRTEADEVSYCLHIILRYEMEQAIFRDHVPVSELPALWNDKMEALLGIRPETDAEGILQDMHWSDGSFGYFPSYLLGSIYDGMLLQAVKRDVGDVDELLKAGRIKDITKWLNNNIHHEGSMYTAPQIMERLGLGTLSAKPLLEYFYGKYSKIYGF